jgi:hypothetical protein
VVTWPEWAPTGDGHHRKGPAGAAWEADGNVLPANAAGWVFEGRDFASWATSPTSAS